MNYSEVRSLLDAGFTADEIRGFMNNPQNPQNNPQTENTNISEMTTENRSEKESNSSPAHPDPEGDQANAKSENTNIPQNTEKLDALNETINNLIRTIQASNLHNNSVQSSAPDIDKQVDGIMASIIRPEHNTKGD